jgi:hypothetical protein
VTGTPLAEVGELNLPQEPTGAQLQVTPRFAESLATVAVTGVVSLTYRDVGVGLSVTVMGGVPAVMAMEGRLANTAGLVTEVAVMVTALTAVAGAV